MNAEKVSRIEVTASDIMDAKRGDELRCPIAKAIYRCTGRRVAVNCRPMTPDRLNYVAEALPEAAYAAMILWDNHGQMTPFDFDLVWL